MKEFLGDEFLLETESAVRLYMDYAESLPIIDYHNHLSSGDIAEDRSFKNLTQIWLEGDHYKWRAMRANGIDEHFITGDASDFEKFQKWAEAVPYTVRNPLYHWTHLELKRYFGVEKLLTADTAEEIYNACSEMLQSPEYSTRSLLQKMNVEVLCTTDDPADDLHFHSKLHEEDFEVRVLPAFRPDGILTAEDSGLLAGYIGKLEEVTGEPIGTLIDLLNTIKSRLNYFHEAGCRLSDHGLEQMPAEKFDFNEVSIEFNRWRSGGNEMTLNVQKQFNSLLLHQLATWYHDKGWVQQFHLGAIRNNNTRLMETVGADAGCDSIGDFEQAQCLSTFLNRLDLKKSLAKTILYNLNPGDNEVFASMAGNFQGGGIVGKVQWGSAWWFLDQKDGIERQLDTLSNLGLLSRFIGMLTDSRSFLSFPRHEYFRRILCNLIGRDIENGKLPDDKVWLGKIIQDICYYNAKNYFEF